MIRKISFFEMDRKIERLGIRKSVENGSAGQGRTGQCRE